MTSLAHVHEQMSQRAASHVSAGDHVMLWENAICNAVYVFQVKGRVIHYRYLIENPKRFAAVVLPFWVCDDDYELAVESAARQSLPLVVADMEIW